MANADRAKQFELLVTLFATGESRGVQKTFEIQLKYFLCINLVAPYECFELTTNKTFPRSCTHGKLIIF